LKKENNIGTKVLDSYKEVIRTLKSLNDCYFIKSNFLICHRLKKMDIKGREPFCPGFLDGIETRKELIRRLNKLGKREKIILLLFYTLGKPIEYIECSLSLCCRHCYRIKKRALEKIVNFDKEEKINTS